MKPFTAPFASVPAKFSFVLALLAGMHGLARATDNFDALPATRGANTSTVQNTLSFAAELPANNILPHLDNNAAYRRAIAFWQLGEICDPEKLEKFFNTPENKDFSVWLRANPGHLETYLVNHPNVRKERGTGALKTWAKIWEKDPESRDGLWLRVALGQALETPGNADNARIARSIERYEFMKRSVAEKKFFDEFETLAPWEIRFVASAEKPISESEWCQKYIAEKKPGFTPENVGGSGYAIPYRLKNYAGISIHKGAAYYDFKPQTFQLQIEYGGVCGAISTLGAWFGISHGIPALPVGQPAHCALIFRPTAHTWKIGNGVAGWDKTGTADERLMQWGGRASQVFLFDDFYKNYDAARRSCLALWTIRFLEKTNRRTDVLSRTLCETGLAENAFNFDLMCEYAALNAKGKTKATDCKRLAAALVEAWKMHPLLAADTVQLCTEHFIQNLSDRELVNWIDTVGNIFGGVAAAEKDMRNQTAAAFTVFVAGQLRQLGLNPKVARDLAEGKTDKNFRKSIPKEKQAAAEIVLQAACYTGLKNPEIAGGISRAYFNISKDDPVHAKSMRGFFDQMLAQARNAPKKDAAILLARILILTAEDAGDAEAVAQNTFYALQQRLESEPQNKNLWRNLIRQLTANAEEFPAVKALTGNFLNAVAGDENFSAPVRGIAQEALKNGSFPDPASRQ